MDGRHSLLDPVAWMVGDMFLPAREGVGHAAGDAAHHPARGSDTGARAMPDPAAMSVDGLQQRSILAIRAGRHAAYAVVGLHPHCETRSTFIRVPRPGVARVGIDLRFQPAEQELV